MTALALPFSLLARCRPANTPFLRRAGKLCGAISLCVQSAAQIKICSGQDHTHSSPRWRLPAAAVAAGVDVHADDSLGRLALSDDGISRRELMVLDTCLAAGIPVAGLVGGGCASPQALHVLLLAGDTRTVLQHCDVLTVCGGPGMLQI